MDGHLPERSEVRRRQQQRGEDQEAPRAEVERTLQETDTSLKENFHWASIPH